MRHVALVPYRAAIDVCEGVFLSMQERLNILHAVDHKTRIRLALRLVQHALDNVKGVASSTSGAGAGGESGSNQSSGSSRGEALKMPAARLPRRGLQMVGCDLMQSLISCNSLFSIMGALDCCWHAIYAVCQSSCKARVFALLDAACIRRTDICVIVQECLAVQWCCNDAHTALLPPCAALRHG